MTAQFDPAKQRAGFANLMGGILVTFLCACTAWLIYIVTSDRELPDKILSIVMYVLGFLTAKISTVIDWCFGTSESSKRQQEVIGTMVDTAAKAQDALPPVPGSAPTVPVAPGEKVIVAGTEEKPT